MSTTTALETGKIQPRLKAKYNAEIKKALQDEFGYDNVMQIPGVVKVVVNMGVGDAARDAKLINGAVNDLALITGQKPVITKAKKSIASFKLREGNPIGARVTLRGKQMYHFLERLLLVALPRTRDFRGVNPNAFDGRGNYTLGIREQLIFPEIEYDKIDRVRGLELSIVTTAHTDDEARRLLSLLGMPFRR